jgi:hypothetical protein
MKPPPIFGDDDQCPLALTELRDNGVVPISSRTPAVHRNCMHGLPKRNLVWASTHDTQMRFCQGIIVEDYCKHYDVSRFYEVQSFRDRLIFAFSHCIKRACAAAGHAFALGSCSAAGRPDLRFLSARWGDRSNCVSTPIVMMERVDVSPCQRPIAQRQCCSGGCLL